MVITNGVLQTLRTMLRGEFAAQWGEPGASTVYKDVAAIPPGRMVSSTYGRPARMDRRRVIIDIREFSRQITNRKFESKIDIPRDAIEDDNFGQYKVLVCERADAVIRFFNKEITGLLAGGFENICYDGRNFSDTDHPAYPDRDGTGDPAGAAISAAGCGGRRLRQGRR